MAGDFTYLLYACTVCGKLKTKKIKGHWKIVEATVASDKELQKIR